MKGGRLLLGYDVGSSSIKASLLDIGSGAVVAAAQSPEAELPILAERSGWAEQHPDTWWDHARKATAILASRPGVNLKEVAAIGISYQMHGLVMVDRQGTPLAPAIIWCDSRAVEIGNKAFEEIGPQRCLPRLLNSPGNFTASKLCWIRQNRPEVYRAIHKIMLPGDFLAFKLTGEMATTPSGLSEGILWDFQEHGISGLILGHYGIDPDLIPPVVRTFSIQGTVTAGAAAQVGIPAGIPVSYRAGDQPNNALSLKVLNPGELAATAGTSGVVYGVIDQPAYDAQSRVNTFVHVNYTRDLPRYGVLLCVNGTGILNSWVRHTCMTGSNEDALSYSHMNRIAATAPVGSGGVVILPYGNGAERTLGNRNPGASIQGLSFTTHSRPHLLRAAQEGIVFALNYGVEIMRAMGMRIETVRAGKANMFLSPLFCEAFAGVTGARVELFNTDGSQGAARGAGMGAGLYRDSAEAFSGLTSLQTIDPPLSLVPAYQDAYGLWKQTLERQLSN